MSLYRVNPRRDSVEGDIVKALESMGFAVTRISGRGIPDLLLSRRGVFYLAEVKSAKGTLSLDQLNFRAKHQVAIPLLRSVEAAATWAQSL
jgi:Holliday junction resolvase